MGEGLNPRLRNTRHPLRLAVTPSPPPPGTARVTTSPQEQQEQAASGATVRTAAGSKVKKGEQTPSDPDTSVMSSLTGTRYVVIGGVGQRTANKRVRDVATEQGGIPQEQVGPSTQLLIKVGKYSPRTKALQSMDAMIQNDTAQLGTTKRSIITDCEFWARYGGG